MSEIVIELEIVQHNGTWYRRGLDWRGQECWEELEEGEYTDELETRHAGCKDQRSHGRGMEVIKR